MKMRENDVGDESRVRKGVALEHGHCGRHALPRLQNLIFFNVFFIFHHFLLKN